MREVCLLLLRESCDLAPAGAGELIALDNLTSWILSRMQKAHRRVWEYGPEGWAQVDESLLRLWRDLAAATGPASVEGVPLADVWSHYVISQVHRAHFLGRAIARTLEAHRPDRCVVFFRTLEADSELLRITRALLDEADVPWRAV